LTLLHAKYSRSLDFEYPSFCQQNVNQLSFNRAGMCANYQICNMLGKVVKRAANQINFTTLNVYVKKIYTWFIDKGARDTAPKHRHDGVSPRRSN
jgi:hypothetical protein